MVLKTNLLNKLLKIEKMKLLTKAELKRIIGGNVAVPDCSTGPCKFVSGTIEKSGTCNIRITKEETLTEKAEFECYCSAAGTTPVNYNNKSHCDKSNPMPQP
ncbi:hypothetical protein [Chryseobacterium sp. SL1]|uniref:hypothetical protein n=1 Tax=Chryseobacterium sp. SL1 TaxID=2995159 RepID=UPI0022740588|nr:hypothetical protein [Chryseobacterium sp. SL1]MCY1662561.1 hypothetical protein [Chryseobacterium sp. SL1]